MLIFSWMIEFLIQKLSYVAAICFLEILCIPKGSDKPWEKQQTLFLVWCSTQSHICFFDKLFWSWKCIEFCKMNSKNFQSELFYSADNEWSNSFHSVAFWHHTFGGTGSPLKHIKASVDLEKQSPFSPFSWHREVYLWHSLPISKHHTSKCSIECM